MVDGRIGPAGVAHMGCQLGQLHAGPNQLHEILSRLAVTRPHGGQDAAQQLSMALEVFLCFVQIGHVALVGDLAPLIRCRIVQTLATSARTGFARGATATL